MDQSGWDKRKYLTNADLLQYIIQHHDQVIYTTAGHHFEYSNTNYAFLALIIEKVSGETYNEFLTKTFFPTACKCRTVMCIPSRIRTGPPALTE